MKIVNESLNDFRLNESVLSKFFKKIGKFFAGLINGKPAEAQLPVNIALAQTGDSAFSMLPSPESIRLAPELGSITMENIIEKLNKQKTVLNKIQKPVGSVSEEYKTQKLVKEKLLLEDETADDREWISLDHPDTNVPNIDAVGLQKLLQRMLYFTDNPVVNKKGRHIKPRSIVIWGAPGIGKTEIVKACLKIAKSKREPLIIQLQNMRGDEWFVPYVDKDEKGNLVYNDVKKSWLPCYKETGDPEYDKIQNNLCNGGTEEENGPGGLLFFDEISRADGEVQGSVMNLINEGRLDQYVMGDRWIIVTAANRPMDDPDTQIKWSTALGDRITQRNYIPEFKHWAEWASAELINPAVINFLNFAEKKMFYGLATGDIKHGPSPRSWAYVSDLLAMVESAKDKGELAYTDAEVKEGVAGEVGIEAAEQFITFFKLLQQYPIESIKAIFTNPEKAPMPYKTGSNTIKMAEANALISTAITFMQDKDLTPEAFANFCKYLVRLDNNQNGGNAESVATMAYKMMIAIHPQISSESGYANSKNAKYKAGVDIFSNYYL